MSDETSCQVAVYYFPNWHPCPRNDRIYGPGESEWKIVRNAVPRFPGHQQPKVPLWGYHNEADPLTAERIIGTAADHGIDAFIYDWYWDEHGPFLHEALETGYWQARNNERIRFGIMWANHQRVSRRVFEQAVDYVVSQYFSHPSYWKIDGAPYFSIYELNTLIAGLGGVEEVQAALAYLKAKTKEAGFPDLHLNAVEFGLRDLPGGGSSRRSDLVAKLGFDSVTSYVWAHNPVLPEFPCNPYPAVAERAYEYWERFTSEFDLPYHPNVTMGWDAWPRAADAEFAPGPYPRTPIITGNTPEEFYKALQRAKEFLSTAARQRILTINAWNEWTEGSYLEPDTTHGMGYLEAIRAVFGN